MTLEANTIITPTPTEAAPAAAPVQTQVTKTPKVEVTPKDILGTEAPKEQPKAEEAKPIEYSFKAPEGITLDQDAVKEFSSVANEAHLPPEIAQKAVDIGIKQVQKVLAQRDEAIKQFIAERNEKWFQDVVNDKELGGANLPKTQAELSKVTQQIDKEIPGFREYLVQSGQTCNPFLVKLVHNYGKLINAKQMPFGNPQTQGKDLAHQMFPGMN